MGVEIERKFLVKGDAWKKLGVAKSYKQGYLSAVKERTVRVRMIEDDGYVTIKGPRTGAARAEYEYPIPGADAREIIETLCEKPIVEKIRRKIPFAGFVWEVDEFLGVNAGLVVAEIELPSESQAFEKPDWIGDEVTEDPRYSNSNLVKKPFSTW
jgi:adenylate cyclase